MSIQKAADRLVEAIRPLGDVAVAFSAGVDSTVVAKAAFLALGDRAIAFTSDSPSLARDELRQSIELATLIGIPHHVLRTAEGLDDDYVANDLNRCYYCKSHLYAAIERVGADFGFKTILNGTNADDLADYRPGLRAAAEFSVVSPLLDCGMDKALVRALADLWALPVSTKPAMPCLASRVAYGTAVTPERLAMVEAAEVCLHQLEFPECRVRFHEGAIARIEVPLNQLPRLVDPKTRESVASALRKIGFQFVTIDLNGFQSGGLNVMIPVESLENAIRESSNQHDS